jgi:hypothetical protein
MVHSLDIIVTIIKPSVGVTSFTGAPLFSPSRYCGPLFLPFRNRPTHGCVADRKLEARKLTREHTPTALGERARCLQAGAHVSQPTEPGLADARLWRNAEMTEVGITVRRNARAPHVPGAQRVKMCRGRELEA